MSRSTWTTAPYINGLAGSSYRGLAYAGSTATDGTGYGMLAGVSSAGASASNMRVLTLTQFW